MSLLHKENVYFQHSGLHILIAYINGIYKLHIYILHLQIAYIDCMNRLHIYIYVKTYIYISITNPNMILICLGSRAGVILSMFFACFFFCSFLPCLHVAHARMFYTCFIRVLYMFSACFIHVLGMFGDHFWDVWGSCWGCLGIIL